MRTRNILIGILVAVLVIGGASAAVLSEYGFFKTTEMTVQQSVILHNADETGTVSYTIDEPIAGNTYQSEPFTIENRADIPAYISFKTDPQADYGSGFVDANYPDITVTTSYWGVLELENKNPGDWSIIEDTVSATLRYKLQAANFRFELEGKVPLADTDYALVYYIDSPNRFDPNVWGGENGIVIATMTSDGDGNIALNDYLNLEKDLPISIDWNAGNEADYGVAPDNYKMRTGAKLWLVPTAVLTDGSTMPIVKWQPANFLFETDLIAYHDADNGCGLRLGANSEIDLYIENKFVINAKPGAYKITTTVVPETACP